MGGALRGRWQWPLLALVAIGLGILVGVFIVRSTANPNAGAQKAAETYTYARLTHDYSTWWDTASPACRPTSSKSQWISDISSGFKSLGTPGDPPETKVRAASLRRQGDVMQVDVRVNPPSPLKSADVEVDVQQQNGSWVVVGYGPPGEADHCAVL
jgi:hypothetical protein